MRTHVLVVDDDPLIVAVACKSLDRAGFDVAGAGSAAEALAQVAANRFDVAILDYYLPFNQCGCSLIAPLRAHNPTIRIVILSGLGDQPELIRHCHACGADYVESKIHVDWLTLAGGGRRTLSPVRPALNLAAQKRETILGVFLVHGRNVSSTARALGMRRANLQRVLRKIRQTDLFPNDE